MADTGEKIEIKAVFGGDSGAENDTKWNAPEQSNQAQPPSHVTQRKEVLMTQYAFDLGRQATAQAVGRIGTYTGNYVLQNQVNNLSMMLNIGASVATSLATGNPLPVLSMALSLGVQSLDYSVEVQKANLVSMKMLEISGNSIISGSRGSGKRV